MAHLINENLHVPLEYNVRVKSPGLNPLRRLHMVFDRARSRARAARFESLRMLK